MKENFPFEGDDRERGRGRLEMQCGSSLGHMLQLPWMLELAAKVRETFEAGKLNNGEEERGYTKRQRNLKVRTTLPDKQAI